MNWDLKPGALTLHWAESCGPSTKIPTRPGFGTRIVTASIERAEGIEPRFTGFPVLQKPIEREILLQHFGRRPAVVDFEGARIAANSR